MHDISYRLKTLMGPLSVRKFAERLELAPTTLQEYLKGRMPPADFIVRVCERLDIDPSWLMTGKGEMKPDFRYKTADGGLVVGETKSNYPVLSDLEEMLLRIIKEGDVTKLAAVRGVLAVYDPGNRK